MKRKAWIEWFAGKMIFQNMFEKLFTASVYGMNYGNGDVQYSGESFAARYIRKKLLQCSAQPFCLFDVGANQGKYTTRLARAFEGADYIIHAFEPSAVIYQAFCKNTDHIKKLKAHPVGLGEHRESRTLYKRASLSGHASVYHRRLDHFNMSFDIQETIQITTLDEFCTEQDIKHIHFLKMDVEGHEWHCLKGGSGILTAGKIDFIQFEFGGCNIDSRTFFQDFWYLLHEQYHFYRIVKNGLVPIKAYNERLEIFKNINFLLERKSLG